MRLLLLVLSVTSLPSLAQEAAPDVSSPPSTEARVEDLSGRLASVEAQSSQAQESLLSLKRLKISGYVQARYTYLEGTAAGADARGNPLVKDGFTVRRGRLKTTYDGPYSRLVLQIDAVPKGVTLKDAEVHLLSPWKPLDLTLIVGQTKWPFGYEVLQSSSDREFPERSRVVRAFAPGERDRGAKLGYKRGALRLMAGVFDGNGVDNRGFIGVDNDTEKDVVGRVGVDFEWVAGGISGWYGNTFRPTDFTVTPNVAGRYFRRDRIGADVQLSLNLLPIGTTSLKGEFIAGTTYQSGGVERFGQTALGWYALLVQKLGKNTLAAVRYDFFDGFTGTPNRVDPADPTRAASTNSVGTLGLALAYQWDASVKLTAAYEMPMTATGADTATDPADNLFTLQFQAKY